MIRENRKLPKDVQSRIPLVVKAMANEKDVVALYAFGSMARNALKPLSDLDFGVLLSYRLDKNQRFEKHLDLIGLFTDALRTDEVDLILMNDVSYTICYQIVKTCKLLICNSRMDLIDFTENLIRSFLDFKFIRDDFDATFLKGVGHHG